LGVDFGAEDLAMSIKQVNLLNRYEIETITASKGQDLSTSYDKSLGFKIIVESAGVEARTSGRADNRV
jgi:hypothetical protein